MGIDLALDVIDLELEINRGILDPFQTGIEVLKCFFHVCDLFGLIAADIV